MNARSVQRRAAAAVLAGLILVGGCGTEQNLDPTPERLDGSSSQEFEAEDIERAENASEAVQDYCSGAVSEAQRIGCLSHVEEGDLP